MPRKDPITGCEVMTTAEFWQAEAEKEGRSAGQLQDDFFNEIADIEQKEIEKLADVENVLNILREYVISTNEYVDEEDKYSFQFTKVLEVWNNSYSCAFRGTSFEFCAKAKCDDEKIREVEFSSWQSSGSFYEPPDMEENLKILKEE